MQKKSSKKNKRKNWRLLIFFSQQVLCLVAITVLSFFITIDWSIIIAFCVCIILGVILVLIDKEKILVDKGGYPLPEYCYWCFVVLFIVAFGCQMFSNIKIYSENKDSTRIMINAIGGGATLFTTFITFFGTTHNRAYKEQMYVTRTELEKMTKFNNYAMLTLQQIYSLMAIIVLSIFVAVNWIIIVVFSICFILSVILILIDKEKISVGDKTYYWFQWCYICLCFLSIVVLIWQTISDITTHWGGVTAHMGSEKLIPIICVSIFVLMDIAILIYIMKNLKPKEGQDYIVEPDTPPSNDS